MSQEPASENTVIAIDPPAPTDRHGRPAIVGEPRIEPGAPPETLPMIGDPNATDAYGYPRSTIDRVGLLALIHAGRYDTLNGYLDRIRAAVEEDPRKEMWEADVALGLTNADPALESKLEAWVAQTPAPRLRAALTGWSCAGRAHDFRRGARARLTLADLMDVIFETVHGSRAYGLAREGSDTDRKGIVVGPPNWYLGIENGPEQVDLSPDHVRFDVRKILRLLLRANPTMLEVLYTDPSDHEVVTPAGQRLLDAREGFVTRQVADTFGGYARGQLERIRTHRRWLLDPPDKPPERAAFGLPEKPPVAKDQLGAAETLAERGALDASSAFLELLTQEKRFRAARERWKQYQQWRKTRNPKRSALEAKFGYDTKHGMHLLRLQRMAIEILRGEGVRVRRDDRDELLAIRDGALSYDALVAESERNHQAIAEAKANCTLPERADPAAADALCVAIIETVRGG